MQENYKQSLGVDLWFPVETLPGLRLHEYIFQTFLQDLESDKGKLKQN